MDNFISEKEARLKYFYMIDTDAIIEKIRTSDIYRDLDPAEPDSLFYMMFDEIRNATSRYTSFILTRTPFVHSSYFKEAFKDTDAESAFMLCGLSLFYHCVMHGFHNALRNSKEYMTVSSSAPVPASVPKSNDPVNISAATEDRLNSGFFFQLENPDKKYEPEKFHSYADYTNFYRRFRNRQNEHRYSEEILRSLLVRPVSSNESQPRIYNYQSNAAYFLFTNGCIKTFNTTLSKPFYKLKSKITFLNQYCDLYNDGIMTFKKEQLIPDQILFDMVMEPAYHFALASYVFTLFDALYNPTSEDQIKCLAGEAFNNILSDYVFKLPITYNRSIFLKYACTVITGSPSSTASFPPEYAAPANIKYDSIAPISGDIFASEALQTIGKFFRTLNYVVLPILEDTWDLLLTKLGLDKRLTLANYGAFLKKHYPVMSSDFSMHTDLFKDITNRQFTYKDLVLFLAERNEESKQKANDQKSSNDHKPAYCSPVSMIPQPVYTNFGALLHNQFVVPHPLSNSAIFDLIKKGASQTANRSQRIPYDVEIKEFQVGQLQNLIHLVQKLDMNYVSLPEKI